LNKYRENLLVLNLACRNDYKFGSATHSGEFKQNSAFSANLNKLHPAYVTGFCDGEACFHLAIGENSRYKLGYYVNPGFSIALHKKDKEFLVLLQEFFAGVGCFFVKSLYNKNNELRFVLGCQITQHSRDSLVMHKICSFFNCGRVEISRKIYDNYVVTKLPDINKIIIPFFTNFPVMGSKRKEFEC